ncbi:MAG: hypothetical protein N4A61_06660 [Pelagimonas sp.]|jgi:flagellar motility protein MotE (MotC chaperone)|nr:hypothetical protein [Pelagimonas sp.]
MAKPERKNKLDKKQKPKSKRRTRGALAAVGSLLLLSAVFRAVVGASEAIAKEEPVTTQEDQAPPGNQVASDFDNSGPSQIYVTEEDILPLVAALNAREQRVSTRETEIDVRMQALSVAEQEIERKLKALEGAEKALRETMATASQAAEGDVARLTEVYSNMKPKQAAALFEEMDPEFSAGFLARMRSDSAAAIMAGLSPETAYLISVVLAGRNANVPTE